MRYPTVGQPLGPLRDLRASASPPTPLECLLVVALLDLPLSRCDWVLVSEDVACGRVCCRTEWFVGRWFGEGALSLGEGAIGLGAPGEELVKDVGTHDYQ